MYRTLFLFFISTRPRITCWIACRQRDKTQRENVTETFLRAIEAAQVHSAPRRNRYANAMQMIYWEPAEAAMLRIGGVCFNCRMMERMRETSLLLRDAFGLKSHSLAIRSHSWPASGSATWVDTRSFSAFLRVVWSRVNNCFHFFNSEQRSKASSRN